MVNNRGVTLMEVMIVTAIIGIVALTGPAIINAVTKIFVLNSTKLELQREARSTMMILTRIIRQARSNTIVISRGTNQPYYSKMDFTMIQGTNVTIQQSGTSLWLTEGVTISTVSRNVSYLSFTFPRSDDLTIVSVSLTLQKLIYNGLYKALHMASEKIRVMN